MNRSIAGLLVVMLLVSGWISSPSTPAGAMGRVGVVGETPDRPWPVQNGARQQDPNNTYLTLMAIGPVDLLVTDPQGRRVGVDPASGQVVNEIPGTYYYGPHQTFEGVETESMSIPQPLTGTCVIRMTGTGEGWFVLSAGVGSFSGGELLLRDTGTVSVAQVIEYTVEGRPLPLHRRAVSYALQVMREFGGWNSTLHLQNTAEASRDAMVILYNTRGGFEPYASVRRKVLPSGLLSISLLEEQELLSPRFHGMATVESGTGLDVVVALTGETRDGRRVATEGITHGAPMLYVPYWPGVEEPAILQVQNIGDVRTTVRVECFEPDGSLVPDATVTLTISSRASVILATAGLDLPPGFQGSAVVESLTGSPLVGAVFLGDLAGRAALYSLPSTPSAALFVPQVLKGAYGLDTFLQVQNTTAAPARVTIRYYDHKGQPLDAAATRMSLPPHGAARVRPAENPALPSGFAGSAVVESPTGAPLSAVVVAGGEGLDLAATSAFYAGSARLALPYLSNVDGQPIVQVQNLGGQESAVRLQCFGEEGDLAYEATVELPPKGYASFATETLSLPDDFTGSALLESRDGQPLAAFAWQQGMTAGLSLYGGVPVEALLLPPASIASAPAYAGAAPFTITYATNAPPAEVAWVELWARTPLSPTWQSTGAVLTATAGAFVYTPTAGDGAYHFATVAADRRGRVEERPAGAGDARTLYDTAAPSSTAFAPPYAGGPSVTVTFAASDTLSGVAHTELWVRPPGGTWQSTALTCTGAAGAFLYTPTAGEGTYYFATRAQDHAGNAEAVPTGPGDAATLYDTTPPSSTASAPPYTHQPLITVTFRTTDTLSGPAYTELWVRLPQSTTWAGTGLTQTGTTGKFLYSPQQGEGAYHFATVGVDNLGNRESAPTGPGDASTLYDTTPPSATVAALPLYQESATFLVSWSGSDNLAGIAFYDLYSWDEAQSWWSPWLTETTTISATFEGTTGHTYHFLVCAQDRAGNDEPCPATAAAPGLPWPIASEAHSGVVPWSRLSDLPPYSYGPRCSFAVSWRGSPDVQAYDLQVRDGLYGSWTTWLKGGTFTQAQFYGQCGHIYCFRSRGLGEETREEYPYEYDTCTKAVSDDPGGEGPGGGLLALPPDEAPDRMEEVTRTQALGALGGYIAPEGDVDWYRFALTATLRLRIGLLGPPADYDVYVFDGSGRFLWGSTWGRRLPEEIVVRVPAGVYYVELVGYAGDWDGGVPYRLLVEVVGGGGGNGGSGDLGASSGLPAHRAGGARSTWRHRPRPIAW